MLQALASWKKNISGISGVQKFLDYFCEGKQRAKIYHFKSGPRLFCLSRIKNEFDSIVCATVLVDNTNVAEKRITMKVLSK